MSRDRKLLYKLILGIEKGDISAVASSRIGQVHQARWLTLASRVLRLYCSAPDNFSVYLNEILERLSTFIIQVYFKVLRLIGTRHTSILTRSYVYNYMAYQRLTRDDCCLYPLTDLNFFITGFFSRETQKHDH